MNPFEMVVMIIAIIAVSRVLQAKYGVRSGRDRWRQRDGMLDVTPERDDGETRRLRDEVQMLKQRIQVLERIAVDKENSVAREIEQLRDR